MIIYSKPREKLGNKKGETDNDKQSKKANVLYEYGKKNEVETCVYVLFHIGRCVIKQINRDQVQIM